MHDVLKPNLGPIPTTESGRSRLGGAIPLQIAGIGGYAPCRVVSNDELAHLGCDSQWIVQRTGIRERRFASNEQASSDLAYEAAIDCLQYGGVDAKNVDLLIVATITPDHSTPSTACLVQQRLGCISPAMDLSAACSGFVYGLITAAQFIHSGAVRNALVIGAEVMSRTVSSTDVKTYPLFGDGAGAVLLQPIEPQEDGFAGGSGPGIIAYTLGSQGDVRMLSTPAGGSREPLTVAGLEAGRQFMRMDGRDVFKWAVRCIVDSCRDVMKAAGLTMDDVDQLILHQANLRIIDAAIKDLGIPREKAFVNLDRYGNTSAASIPLALNEAVRQGSVARGSLVLLCGFGAGLTWGTALIRW